MQLIKFVILSLVIFLSVADKCLAAPEEICYPAENIDCVYSEKHCGYDLLNSFIGLFLNNAGDLTDSNVHNSYDKKSFLLLFYPSRYNKIHPPFWYGEQTAFYIPAYSGPEKNQYYLYTLREIIV